MGLETGTYIDSLNASNPVGATDPKSQGDDHIRLIKSTILATFPNITGAITKTHTEINDAAELSAANAFTGANTFDGNVSVLGGNSLILKDSTNADDLTASHDGTDFNWAFTGTTDWNITGLTAIQAGTIDADFDALTATSYDGIAAANLVDKTASETISGATWDFQAITAVSFGGIASANLVDKSASETISGATWDFQAITAVSFGGIASANLVDKSAAETISGAWVFSAAMQVATIEIGHASDTTLSRDAAGQLAVEGDAIFSHESGTYTSAKVHFSNGTEPTTEGSNGDIFLVY